VGEAAAPLEIFWPPLDDFFILGHYFQGTLVSGSKRRSKSSKDLYLFIFFLENAGFSGNKTIQFR